MENGKLEQLVIYSYKNEADMKAGESSGTFSLQINPNEFKRSFGVHYYSNEHIGNYATEKQMAHVLPQTLSFEITLDGTGIASTAKDGRPLSSLSYKEKGRDDDYVNNKLKELRQFTVDYDGETHQVPFAGVNWWGDEKVFKGVVSNLDITYQLFTEQGKPLRAKVAITVDEHIPIDIQTKENNESSPDLTHSREVKDGDNLMILTRDIYGDPKYYREVARVNGLVNFRKLKTGMVLVFPPIEKQNS